MPQQSQNPGIFLSGDEFTELDGIVGSIPGKYAIFFIDFFRKVQHTRRVEAEAEETAKQQDAQLSVKGEEVL